MTITTWVCPSCGFDFTFEVVQDMELDGAPICQFGHEPTETVETAPCSRSGVHKRHYRQDCDCS